MWAYGAGYAFSIYKTKIEGTIQANYLLSLCISIIIFVVLYNLNIDYRGIKYNLLSISFVSMIVILTMKVSLSNKFLIWVGVHLFPMYIYQRIPMIYLSNQYGDFCCDNPVLFILFSALLTIIISHFYKYWQIKLR